MAYKRISPQPVVEGGTGAQSFTLDGVLIGNTTGAIQVTAAGTTGQVLTGVTGAAPTFQAVAASSITITGDSGGGLTGNAFTFTGGTTGLTFAGAVHTETLGGTLIVANGGTGATTLTGVLIGHGTSAVTGNAITQHDVLVGGASNAITSVAPTATSGIPLVSNGSAADPSFTTAVVAGGGTGVTTLTAYAPIVAGTTSTGAVQQATTGFSTVGNILTTNGSSAVPSWTAPSGVGGLVFITNSSSSSSSSVTITTGITTTYDDYYLFFKGSIASTVANLLLQFSTNGGSTWTTTGYHSSPVDTSSGIGVFFAIGSQPLTIISNIWMNNLTAASNLPSANLFWMSNSTNLPFSGAAAGWHASLAVNAIRIITSDGSNMSSAQLYLYGYVL